jgi:hypothetical protein
MYIDLSQVCHSPGLFCVIILVNECPKCDTVWICDEGKWQDIGMRNVCSLFSPCVQGGRFKQIYLK